MLNCVANCGCNQATRADAANWLDADPDLDIGLPLSARVRKESFSCGFRSKANFCELFRKFLLKNCEKAGCIRGPCLKLNSGINIFGVFAEDHHVDLLRRFDR